VIQAIDIQLVCRECGKQFIFTEGEQRFYSQMGFNTPARCKHCRSMKENLPDQIACSECGIELQKDAGVYCETCFNNLRPDDLTCSQCGIEQERGAHVYCGTCLKQVQLDSDRKVEKLKRSVSATQSKLQVAEFQNEELQKALYETKRYTAELELKVKNLNQDLEKAYQFYVASSWLQPELNAIAERLKALEQADLEITHKVFAAIQKIQEANENVSLWEIMKRSLILGSKT
jgi:hypothetical protein